MTEKSRYHVFLSYHERDERAARLIAEYLRTEHGIQPWLRGWSAVPGRLTQEEQERGLAQSQACAVLIGGAGVRQWQQLEVYASIRKRIEEEGGNFPVIPVYLPECPAEARQAIPSTLQLYEAVTLIALDDQPALQRLAAGIRGEPVLSAAITLPDEPAPYRGLLPFEAVHARFFFGRDKERQRLVERLAQYPFAAVVGASGSGKSSLVKAGLLPFLAKNALPDSSSWRVLLFTPGSQPLLAIASQLSTFLPVAERPRAVDELVARLAERTDVVRSTLFVYCADQQMPILVVVDQFEELFTLFQDGPERYRAQVQQFVENLADAVRKGDGRIRVLITLRADFLGHCLAYPALSSLLEDHQLLLGPLDQLDLHEAIVRPPGEVGALLEKGLAEIIMRDVGSEPGMLPLLQQALYEVWLRRKGPWLTLGAYEESEGVLGALQKRADDTYGVLTPQQQQIARNVFVRLTTLGENDTDTRRRARRDEFYPVNVNRADVDSVLLALSSPQARLIVVDEDTVEVAHETLIQKWKTIRAWLEKDREALRTHRGLTNSSREWHNGGCDESYLYSGVRLDQAKEWAEEHNGELNQLEQQFLEASVALRKRKDANELVQAQTLAVEQRKRAEEQTLAATRLRKQAIAMGVVAFFALMASVLALWQLSNARIAQREAERQARRSKAGELVALSRTASLPQETLLLAIEAITTTTAAGEPALATAEQALRELLSLPHGIPLTGQNAPVSALSFSPDGHWLVTGSKDGTMQLWRMGAPFPDLRVTQRYSSSASSLAFSPNSQRLVIGYSDGTVRVWDLAKPDTLPHTLPGHAGEVLQVAISPDDRWLASCGRDGQLLLRSGVDYDTVDIEGIEVGSISAFAISPDGRWLVAGTWNGTIHLADLSNLDANTTILQGHSGPVYGLTFSPDSQLIASRSEDGNARVWRINDSLGEPQVYGGHTGPIYAMAFSSDGRWLATSSRDGTGRLWEITHPQNDGIALNGFSEPIYGLAFSPDNRILAMAGQEGIIRLWTLADVLVPPVILRDHEGPVRTLEFSPDGAWLASGGEDHGARLWRVHSLQADPFATQATASTATTFSVDGRRIAIAKEDGTISVVDTTDAREQLLPIRGSLGSYYYLLAFSRDNHKLAGIGSDGVVSIWYITEQGVETVPFEHRVGPVQVATFTPDGRWLVAGGEDGVVRAWDTLEPNAPPLMFRGHQGSVYALALDTGGSLLATSGQEGTVRLWDFSYPDKPKAVLRGHEGPVNALTFSLSGDWLATLGSNGSGLLWQLNSPERSPVVLETPNSKITSLVFSPDGNQIAGASEDGFVRIWKTEDPRSKPEVIGGHNQAIRSLAFSPDGRRLATGGEDNTVQLWDWSDPRVEPVVLKGLRNPIESLAFSSDGHRLMTQSQDGAILIWITNPTDLVTTACRLVGRNFTRAEWNRYLQGEPYRLTCPQWP